MLRQCFWMALGFCFPGWLVGARKNFISDYMVQSASHWNQLHITTSGQQMLPRATAVMRDRLVLLKTILCEALLLYKIIISAWLNHWVGLSRNCS